MSQNNPPPNGRIHIRFDDVSTAQTGSSDEVLVTPTDSTADPLPDVLQDKNQPGISGSRTGEEILRRLSRAQVELSRTDANDEHFRQAQDALALTGNVISATFCVPFKIGRTTDGRWELNDRRGTSALFESFAYLTSDECSWKHTLVGWTGEIDRVAQKNPQAPSAPVDEATSLQTTAPIPENPHPISASSIEHSDLKISSGARSELEQQLNKEHGGRVVPVWLADDYTADDDAILSNQQRWRRYGEHELFTLFHYKQNEPSDGRALRKNWADYFSMNKAFADAIIKIYEPGDIILIHDYQLLLLASMLRQRAPKIYIGFFLHIPFPSSEYYRCLTRRKEILEGVLGANMIGFQAYSYARHFSSCCTRILGFDSNSSGVEAYGTHVPVDVLPIGINVDATIEAAFQSDEVEQKMKALLALYDGRKIIVGRDRLDSIRGVAQKLQAYELFLKRHPQWREKVVLIQVTSPTSIEDRDDHEEKVANKISDLVARINGAFGSLSYTPVHHYPQYLSQAEYFALLRIADLGLITSVRDGMNTTALEYVICQRDKHGPLIISEFSGTAGSLGNAIQINPWDLVGTAEEINTALNMTDAEMEKQHRKLYNHVTTNTVQAWTDTYLRSLTDKLTSYDQSTATPLLDRAKLLSQYRNSARRLFMFDYDGTLTPIVRDPQSAIPSDRVIRTLKTLASDPQNQVWIISGRDQAFLDEWMGHISELGLSAEHGSFMRPPNSTTWVNLAEKLDMSWQEKIINEFNVFTERTQGTFTERKKIAVTWHYRRADPDLGPYVAEECKKKLNSVIEENGWDIEVMEGKANLEVRPRFVNKGEIAKRLVNEYEQPPDFVLCLGDDFTDEDMFRSLSQSQLPEGHRFSVTIGAKTKPTLASWHLLEPSDVISAIALLNGSAEAGNIGPVAVVDGAVPEE